MKRSRLLSAIVAAALAIGGALVIAEPAQAATCTTRTYHYNVTDGSVAIVIGSLHVNTHICESSPGHRSSSSSSISFLMSGLGSTTGWVFINQGTSLVNSTTTRANYTSNGALKLCVPTQLSPLCSNPTEFKTTQTEAIPSFIGPIPGPTVGCYVSGCGLHFKYTG
jgi:hypothetical protein